MFKSLIIFIVANLFLVRVEAEDLDICTERYYNDDFKGSIVSPGYPDYDRNENYHCKCTLKSNEKFKLKKIEGKWYGWSGSDMLLCYKNNKYVLDSIPEEEEVLEKLEIAYERKKLVFSGAKFKIQINASSPVEIKCGKGDFPLTSVSTESPTSAPLSASYENPTTLKTTTSTSSREMGSSSTVAELKTTQDITTIKEPKIYSRPSSKGSITDNTASATTSKKQSTSSRQSDVTTTNLNRTTSYPTENENFTLEFDTALSSVSSTSVMTSTHTVGNHVTVTEALTTIANSLSTIEDHSQTKESDQKSSNTPTSQYFSLISSESATDIYEATTMHKNDDVSTDVPHNGTDQQASKNQKPDDHTVISVTIIVIVSVALLIIIGVVLYKGCHGKIFSNASSKPNHRVSYELKTRENNQSV